MTQQELNNKIKKATEELSSLKDTLKQLQDKIKDIEEQLEAERAKVTGDNLDDTVTKNIANLEHQIKTYTDKAQTIQKSIKIQEQLVEQYKTLEPTEETAEISNSTTQYDKEKNAKLAAEHPERTVDGIYYESDDALASAKAAQEKRLQEESKQASAEAAANANRLAAAMKTINETLYGTDNQEILTQLQGTVGGAKLSSILGNAVSVRQRQHLLNFKTFEEDFKEPNSGIFLCRLKMKVIIILRLLVRN